MIQALGIPGGDVTRHAFFKTELREQVEGRDQLSLAVKTLVFGVVGYDGTLTQDLGHGVLLGL